MLKKFFQATETAPSTAQKIELLQHYQLQVFQGHIEVDPQQIKIIAQLQQLQNNLTHRQHFLNTHSAKRWLGNKPQPCRHIYLYGDVGTGKSMLMDLFFKHCPLRKKRRVHFHAFMQEVHARIHVLRQQNHPQLIPALAKEIHQHAELLCFDEFQVTDIADAMILGRLFTHLFELGLVLVLTSNQHPDQLYQRGLQRELFLPFIELIKSAADVLELNNQQDYRMKHLRAFHRRYFFPLNEYADYLIHQSYAKLTNDAPKTAGRLNLLARTVKLTAIHADIVLATFKELCEQPLGAADYLVLAKQFSTVILADIPRLELEQRNAAYRLMTLIDVLYEHKVKLICSADVTAEELYPYQENLPEFKRTISRLIEMQSEAYLLGQYQPISA